MLSGWREGDSWGRAPLRVHRLRLASGGASIKDELVPECFSRGQTVTSQEIAEWLNLSSETVDAITKNLVSLLILTEPHEEPPSPPTPRCHMPTQDTKDERGARAWTLNGDER